MRARLLALILAAGVATSLPAQGFNAEVHRDLNEIQKKFNDLARAIPEAAYGWRPVGARSVGEVLLHVASDNYLIPAMMGTPIPSATGLSATDMKTLETYEKRKLTRDQILEELDASFGHLHRAIGATSTDANFGDTVNFFGSEWPRGRAVLMTVTHLHEHLGQLMAYARSNNIATPWSR